MPLRLQLPKKDTIMNGICSSVATFALLLALGGTAFAHTLPTATSPLAGSTLKVAPHHVVINFTEAIIPRFSGIEVVNSEGKRFDENDAHAGPAGRKQLVADLNALPAGIYRVLWHAAAEDMHKTEGHFDFTVAS